MTRTEKCGQWTVRMHDDNEFVSVENEIYRVLMHSTGTVRVIRKGQEKMVQKIEKEPDEEVYLSEA